jgi:hypothetical protein
MVVSETSRLRLELEGAVVAFIHELPRRGIFSETPLRVRRTPLAKLAPILEQVF